MLPKEFCTILFLFVNISFFHSAYGRVTWNSSPPNTDNCGLACWLSHMIIHIPTETTIYEYVNFTLSNTNCTGIQLGQINSSFIPPSTLMLSPSNLTFHCEGIWSAFYTGLPDDVLSGGVQAMVYHSSVLLGITLNKGEDGLANSSSLSTCVTDVQTDITLTGYIWTGFLDILIGLAEGMIDANLDSVACEEIGMLVNTNLTQIFQEVDTTIRPYLHPQPPSPAPPVPSTGTTFAPFAFSRIHLLIGIDILTDDPRIKIASYLVHILFAPSGSLSFNMLVDKFTYGTGALVVTGEQLGGLEFTFPFVLQNSSVGNITLGIINISAAQLDTWGDVELEPAGNYSMKFHSDMAQLNFNVTFFVNVSIGGNFVLATSLYEEGLLITKLSNNNLNTSFQLALYENTLNSLQATQFQGKVGENV